MTRYIALLRGVNVAGKRRVAMADVRALLAEMGYTEVATYLQSGNAVFTAAAQPAGTIAAAIQDRLAATLGAEVKVVIRTSRQFADVVARNPLRPGR